MTVESSKKEELLHRFARLEGQIRGVRKMIDAESDCEKIVVQLSAVHAALESATKILIAVFFEKCLLESEGKGEDRGEAIKQLTELLLKTRL